MYRLEREEFLQKRFISLWGLLGFQAGYLNAFGFLACGRYISHVTGVGTQLGVATASGQLLFAVELLAFPLFFIFGSFVSSLFTSVQLERGKKPSYDLVTAFLPLALSALALLGAFGFFGPFGEALERFRDFALLVSLTFICGMQNGCFATMTKGQIRTTHLTGISTDIGTDLARYWFGRLDATERNLTWKTNVTRVVTFVGFGLGSVTSVLATMQLQYTALTIPFITSVTAAICVRLIGKQVKISRTLRITVRDRAVVRKTARAEALIKKAN